MPTSPEKTATAQPLDLERELCRQCRAGGAPRAGARRRTARRPAQTGRSRVSVRADPSGARGGLSAGRSWGTL